MAERLDISVFVDPDFGENAYLVRKVGATRAVAVDPGGGTPELIAVLERGGLTLDAILLTHAHVDHVTGVAALVRATGAPVYLHPADRWLYMQAPMQAAMFGFRAEAPPPADREFADGDTVAAADISFEVRHVPGHAPGHVILYVAEAGAAFVGDVVFQGSIGRTDLPGGDYAQLMRSIRERVLTLPDETVLYPGHGPSTTVRHERTTNPFLVPTYGGGLA